MTNPKILPEVPVVCSAGLAVEQVESLLGERFDEFTEWMFGQTAAICQGKKYNHDTGQYEPDCGGVAHGMVFYRWDVARFIEGLPVID